MEGEGLRNLIQGWSGNLFVGITAASAVIFLLKRELVRFIEFAVLAVMIGIFVFKPSVVESLIDTLARAVGAG
jgi:hypothetical protein